ncbi:DUF4132 domain-containing protein [Catellatospora chokoriensis]|nr:DUF4132 domain-containing protein [Catellatospora chokoriensis]
MTELKRAALAQDVPGFVDALVSLSQTDVYWGRQLDAVRDAVKLEELPFRVPAAVALSERLPAVPGEDAKCLLDYVIDYLLMEEGRRTELPDALAILGVAAKYWEFTTYVAMEELGATVLKAGGTLAPEVVAVMRRTATIEGHRSLKAFATGLQQPLLNQGDAWADRALADLSAWGDDWHDLVAHAANVTWDALPPEWAAPTPEWEEAAHRLLVKLGPGRVREVVLGWLALADAPRAVSLRDRTGYGREQRGDLYNSMVLRRLVWLLGLVPPDGQLTRSLADAAEANLRKVPGGPRNRPVAEGAVHALSRHTDTEAGSEALAQLVRLAARVTHKPTAQQIGAAIDSRAEALQATREQVLDFAVLSFGLTEVGRRVQRFGEDPGDTGILRIEGAGADIEWRNGAGMTVGSPPTAVKQGFPEQLQQFRESAKELGRTLPALTAALRRQLGARQSWRYGTWRALVLDHVVAGALARGLLWQVDGRLCGYADGELRPVDGTAMPLPAGDGASVRLWDPASSPPDEVFAAREWLARHGIIQPFPQVPVDWRISASGGEGEAVDVEQAAGAGEDEVQRS